MLCSRRGWMTSLALSLMLLACRDAEAPLTPTPPSVRLYLVGTNAHYAPFESITQDKELAGFDIDILRAVAKHSNLQLSFQHTPWAHLFPALLSGERDILASAISITAERQREMAFSTPYFQARQLIAIRRDSRINNLDGLHGKRIGVMAGTTGESELKRILSPAKLALRSYTRLDQAMLALQSGRVDAVVADSGVLLHYVANNPAAKLRTLGDSRFAKEQYGFAVRKEDRELLARLNAGLAQIMADGSYERIYTQYFGVRP
jgi:polar amino acid transport system substrate-binding protein